MSYILSRTGEPVRENRKLTAAGIAATASANGAKGFNARDYSAGTMINKDGQINAQSTQELMRAIGLLATAAANGIVENKPEDDLSNHQEAIAAAIADPTGQGWLALGEIIGTQVVETMGRAGFARRLLQFNPLAKGDIARVRVRQRDVVAVVSTSDPNITASQVRQPIVYPAFFQIIANILIEDQEINQDYGDLLDDRYNDGLEQLLVAEDRALINLFNSAASIYNPLFLYPSLTPTVWQAMKIAVEEYGNTPVTNAVLSYDQWSDITTDPEFVSWYSELEKHEVAIDGTLGKIAGVEIITDGFRLAKLQVLQPGQLYMVAAPQALGVVAQLGDLNVQSINKYSEGIPKRGWFFGQIEALAIPNAHAVVRGQHS
jgi:hypothetical protein